MRARHVVKRAEVEAKSTVSRVDAIFALLPIPPDNDASPSDIIAFAAQAARYGGSEPPSIVRSARSQFSAKLAEAMEPVKRIDAVASFLKSAASYVEGTASVLPVAPSDVPFEIVSAIRAARHYVKSGMVRAESVTAPLRAAADDAIEIAAKAAPLRRKYASTLAIAINAQTEKYFERCGREDLAAFFKARVATQTRLHRQRFGNSRKNRRAAS